MKTLITITAVLAVLYGTMYIMSPDAAVRMAQQAAQLPHMVSVWLASFGL